MTEVSQYRNQKISGIQVFGETKAKNAKNAASRVLDWEVKG